LLPPLRVSALEFHFAGEPFRRAQTAQCEPAALLYFATVSVKFDGGNQPPATVGLPLPAIAGPAAYFRRWRPRSGEFCCGSGALPLEGDTV
jgi:hypothetical protein